MGKKRVQWTPEEQKTIIKAVENKLPNETAKSVFEHLAEKVYPNKSAGSMSAFYYGHLAKLNRAERKDALKKKETIISRKPRRVVLAEEIFRILTPEQKDQILKNILEI